MKVFFCFGKKSSSPREPLPNGNTGKDLCAESLENYASITNRPTWPPWKESPTIWPHEAPMTVVFTAWALWPWVTDA